MAYFYEEVVAAREAKMRNTYSNIYDGMFLERRILEFEPVEIIKKKFRMMVPCDFVTMPPQMVRKKYPYSNSSLVVKTSLDLSVNLCFSLQNYQVKSLARYAQESMSVLFRINPAYKLETFSNIGTRLAWFDFKSIALDGQLYNIQFFTHIGKELLLGNFSCRKNAEEDWKSAAEQMICSIEDLTNNAQTREICHE